MNIIICLDDKNGILFNNRRQSRDAAVCQRILALAKDSALWMNAYSAKLFVGGDIKISDDFLSAVGVGEYCFLENNDFLMYGGEIEKVIVYRWNKVYPADVKVDSAFFSGKKLVQSTDFAGNSHARITEEIYE